MLVSSAQQSTTPQSSARIGASDHTYSSMLATFHQQLQQQHPQYVPQDSLNSSDIFPPSMLTASSHTTLNAMPFLTPSPLAGGELNTNQSPPTPFTNESALPQPPAKFSDLLVSFHPLDPSALLIQALSSKWKLQLQVVNYALLKQADEEAGEDEDETEEDRDPEVLCSTCQLQIPDKSVILSCQRYLTEASLTGPRKTGPTFIRHLYCAQALHLEGVHNIRFIQGFTSLPPDQQELTLRVLSHIKARGKTNADHPFPMTGNNFNLMNQVEGPSQNAPQTLLGQEHKFFTDPISHDPFINHQTNEQQHQQQQQQQQSENFTSVNLNSDSMQVQETTNAIPPISQVSSSSAPATTRTINPRVPTPPTGPTSNSSPAAPNSVIGIKRQRTKSLKQRLADEVEALDDLDDSGDAGTSPAGGASANSDMVDDDDMIESDVGEGSRGRDEDEDDEDDNATTMNELRSTMTGVTTTRRRAASNSTDKMDTRRKRARKDPNAPKRPTSNYMFWCASRRPALRSQFPDLPSHILMQKIAVEWKNHQWSPEEKRMWMDCQERDQARYKRQMHQWKTTGTFQLEPPVEPNEAFLGNTGSLPKKATSTVTKGAAAAAAKKRKQTKRSSTTTSSASNKRAVTTTAPAAPRPSTSAQNPLTYESTVGSLLPNEIDPFIDAAEEINASALGSLSEDEQENDEEEQEDENDPFY